MSKLALLSASCGISSLETCLSRAGAVLERCSSDAGCPVTGMPRHDRLDHREYIIMFLFDTESYFKRNVTPPTTQARK